MGCMNSKSAGGDAGEGYATLGVEKIDEIFAKATAVSEKKAVIDDGLKGNKMLMFKNTGMEWLQTPSMKASLECWVYSSACDVTDPASFKPDVKMEAPYLELPEDLPLSDANKATKEALQNYIKTLAEAPETLKQLTEEMQGIVDAATAAKDTAADDFGALGAMEKMKAMKNLAGNMKKLQAAQKELMDLPTTVKESAEDMKKTIAGLPEALKNTKPMSEKAKKLEKGDTSAVNISKELMEGTKNDAAAAAKYKKENYADLEKKSEKAEGGAEGGEGDANQV